MIKFIKSKLGITALESENFRLKQKVSSLENFVDKKMEELMDYTRVDADVGYRGGNTIVLTGVYKNKAYVRFYDMGNGEFEGIVNQIKHMRMHSLIRHIDSPVDFRGIFDL